MSIQINKKSNNKTGKKLLVSLLAVAILAIIGYGTFAYTNESWPFGDTDEPSKLSSSTLEDNHGNKIDDQPSDDKNQQRVNDKKEQDRKRIEQNEQNEKNHKGQKNVDVVITTYSQDQSGLHVNGYVDGVIENNGTCKLTITNESGKAISTTRKSHENAKNTTCGQSTISNQKLKPGKWTISLSYSSDTATGSSEASIAPTIEVK